MIKQDRITRSQGDVVIVFRQVEEAKNGEEVKYLFFIKDNEELTSKLWKSVKKHIVPSSAIDLCADALFTLIEDGVFEQVLSSEEIKNLFSRFEEETGEEEPSFQIEDLTVGARSQFRATLIHKWTPEGVVGEARTKGNAKAKALRAFLTMDHGSEEDS